MRIAILTPIRLIGEGIAASLRACDAGFEPVVVCEVRELRALVASPSPPRLAIVDVTQGLPLDPIRAFHHEIPELPLLALGIREQDAEIIAHGSAGFIGYLRREDGLDQLRARVDDAVSGRLLCTPEIAAVIMRGLCSRGSLDPVARSVGLTLRETQVAELVSRGLSNKEIARAFDLSESTVKHHVHSILAKIGVPSRFQLVKEARQDAWQPGASRRAQA